MAPSSTSGATMPLCLGPAMKVVVFQRPGHSRDQTLAARSAAVATPHLGSRPRLVEEHEPCSVHEALLGLPQPALARDVRPVPLGESQGLFSCLRPIRRSVLGIVESRRRSQGRRNSPSSASVMSGVPRRPFQVGLIPCEPRASMAAVAGQREAAVARTAA